jgi:hypothetical protein
MFLSSSSCVGAPPPPPIDGPTVNGGGSTSLGSSTNDAAGSSGDPDTSGTSTSGTSFDGTSTAGTGTIATSTSVTSTTGDEIPPACVAYGDGVALCYDEMTGAAAATYCAETFAYYEMMYGAECVEAFEEYLACLSALTCEELTGMDSVCTQESMELASVCTA